MRYVRGFLRPKGVCVVSVGNEAFAIVCDSGHNKIKAVSLTSAKAYILAGSGRQGCKDGSGEDASFKAPSGVAMLPDGSLLVTDTMNHVIRRVRRARRCVSNPTNASLCSQSPLSPSSVSPPSSHKFDPLLLGLTSRAGRGPLAPEEDLEGQGSTLLPLW